MASYFEESFEVERKQVIELTETVKYARKYFENFSDSVDESGNSIVQFGVNCLNTSKSVEQSIKRIRDVYLAANKALAPFKEIFSSIVNLTLDYTKQGKQMDLFIGKTGLASDNFEALTNANKKYNGSAEQTANMLVSLNNNLKNLSDGGNGNGLKDVADKYGINLSNVKNADVALFKIAQKMGTLSSIREKFELGEAFGLDEATINLMLDGVDAYIRKIEEAKKYNIFTQEDIENSKKFNESLNDIQLGVNAVLQNFSKLLLPVLIPVFEFIQKIVDFFVLNSEMVKAIIIELSVVAVAALTAIAYANWAVIAPILILIALIGIVIAAFVGLNWIIGEFWAWLSGKDSVFTDLFVSFETFKEGMISGFKQLVQKGINLLTGLGNAIKTGFIKLVEFIRAVVAKVMEFIPDWLLNFIKSGGTIGLLFKVAGKGLKALKDASAANGIGFVPFDGYMAELHKGEAVLDKSEAGLWRDLIAGKEAINLTANVPIASVPQGAITSAYNAANTSNSITFGDITIQTQATDADGIANDLVQSIKMAFNGLDTGVRA